MVPKICHGMLLCFPALVSVSVVYPMSAGKWQMQGINTSDYIPVPITLLSQVVFVFIQVQRTLLCRTHEGIEVENVGVMCMISDFPVYVILHGVLKLTNSIKQIYQTTKIFLKIKPQTSQTPNLACVSGQPP